MVSAHVELNIFDAIIFGILFLSGLLSLFRGFVREVLSIIAWVGSALITLYNADKIAEILKPSLGGGAASVIVGTLGTYFLALIVISIINAFLLRYLKPGSEVGALDKILGLAFGITKGAVIVVLGYYILTFVYDEESMPEEIKTAWSYPTIQSATKVFVGLLPDYLQNMTTLLQASPEEKQKMVEQMQREGMLDPTQGVESLNVEKLQEMFSKTKKDPENSGDGPRVIRP
jgi:membrane protein required for colicin V production